MPRRWIPGLALCGAVVAVAGVAPGSGQSRSVGAPETRSANPAVSVTGSLAAAKSPTLPGENRNGEIGPKELFRDVEKRLTAKLNTRVTVKHTPKHGHITIEYFGNEDLQRLLDQFGVGG